MDASATKGAYVDNNDFEGRGAPQEPPETRSDGKGVNMEKLRKAQRRNQYPGSYPDDMWPSADTVLLGTNSSVAAELTKFVNDGSLIVMDFKKDRNAQMIRDKEKKWEDEAMVFLQDSLGPRFAQNFDEQEVLSDPQRLSTEGDNICHLISIKSSVLTTFANQLTASSH
jgi:hypothetical protein